jgi:hypothetical protein
VRDEESEKPSSSARRIDLEPSELALLLRACRKYKASLPSYLRSAQPELALAEELMKKLKRLSGEQES